MLRAQAGASAAVIAVLATWQGAEAWGPIWVMGLGTELETRPITWDQGDWSPACGIAGEGNDGPKGWDGVLGGGGTPGSCCGSVVRDLEKWALPVKCKFINRWWEKWTVFSSSSGENSPQVIWVFLFYLPCLPVFILWIFLHYVKKMFIHVFLFDSKIFWFTSQG